MLEASPAKKLGFVVTGDDKSEGYYGKQPRYEPSNPRRAARARAKLTVSPSAANGDGGVETAAVSEIEGSGDEPAPPRRLRNARSRPARPPRASAPAKRR